jgi:hypothetical protein
MAIPGLKLAVLLGITAAAAGIGAAQHSAPMNATGLKLVNGHETPYEIRHLPINAFPQLPNAVAESLTAKGCLVPQTYEAHKPENVVHASLERAGSSDWAVLCSVDGTVSLLVYFGDGAKAPIVLVKAQETDRLQAHDYLPMLGFNWGIDPATPDRVHDAQAGMARRPARLDHDALADSMIERKTVYHFYVRDTWTRLDVPAD